jgi:predicted enzyme related to lactoylglutathione lyase
MSFEMPSVPAGSGKFPVTLVVISATNLADSGAFYAKVFGWHLQPMSSELTGVMTPAGPTVALRASIPVGFPGIVPYIGVSDLDATLARVVTAGGTVEKAAWKVPMVGTLARFKDAAGTIYGLTDAMVPVAMPRIEMPFGPNPRPPAGAICSLEMYAADGAVAAAFFGELFGWSSLETMPHFMAFDPGAGIGGVFQSHTPAVPAVAYIYANDVAATLAEIDAAGGTRMGEPMRMPGMGCFGYFKDPSDTAMGLIGP